MDLEAVRALRYTHRGPEEIEDCIAPEGRVKIHLNGSLITTQVANTEYLAELGTGYVISEGLSEKIGSVETEGNNVFVSAEDPGTIVKECSTSGGWDIVRSPKRVVSDLRIPEDMIFSVSETIVSEEWKRTGGVHCSVLFRDGKIISKMSDIGRHNTLDKVIGFAALNNIDMADCCIGCTGRQPSGMVSKCANAGIPVIISKAASTAGGIKTAKDTNITLICFARGERFTVYSNEWRIA